LITDKESLKRHSSIIKLYNMYVRGGPQKQGSKHSGCCPLHIEDALSFGADHKDINNDGPENGRIICQITVNITSFADQHRLQVKRDHCGEMYIPCNRGQIFQYGADRFGVMVIGPTATPRTWGAIRRKLLAAGLSLHQDGDAEGCLLFDPANSEHSRLAIQVMRGRRQRRYSLKDRERLSQHLAGVRRIPPTACENVALTA
jgi:hypothetical protein